MSSLEIEEPTKQMGLVQSAWNQLRAQLEMEKVRIYEALANYPPPIAACDQQFNYLLEQRATISRELDWLNTATISSLTIEDSIKQMDEFIQSSSYVDSQAQQTIRSSLQEELARL